MAKHKERSLPSAGSKYEKKLRNGMKYVLNVVKVAGETKYRVGNRVFDSPSGAAESINGGKAANGWVFWKIDR
jgi:hypothetical protein